MTWYISSAPHLKRRQPPSMTAAQRRANRRILVRGARFRASISTTGCPGRRPVRAQAAGTEAPARRACAGEVGVHAREAQLQRGPAAALLRQRGARDDRQVAVPRAWRPKAGDDLQCAWAVRVKTAGWVWISGHARAGHGGAATQGRARDRPGPGARHRVRPARVQRAAGRQRVARAAQRHAGQLLRLELVWRQHARQRHERVAVRRGRAVRHVQAPVVAHDWVAHCARGIMHDSLPLHGHTAELGCQGAGPACMCQVSAWSGGCMSLHACCLWCNKVPSHAPVCTDASPCGASADVCTLSS